MNPLSVSADLDLLTRVSIALTLQDRPAFRDIHVDVQGGVVALRGKLASYLDRKLAYEVVRRVAGVRSVEVDFDGIHRVGIEVPASDETISRPQSSAALRSVALLVLTVTLLVASLTGCSGSDRLPVHPVQGQITFNGKPLANAFVVLHPKSPTESRHGPAQAQTDADGNFRVTTYETGDGAPEGEYAVTVTYHRLQKTGESFAPGPNVLAPKIASPETTDITVRVAAGPNSLQPLDVRR